MSKPLPGHSAANTSNNTLTIPQHWSAEQALAVYELLNDIQAQIWKQYDLKLIALLRPDPDEINDGQLDLFEFDDEIDF